VRRVALALVIAALVIEGAAAVFTARLEERGELYAPQTAEGYDAYLKTRDPVLGWPPPGPKKTYDRFGACAAVFGSTLSAGAGAYPQAVGARLDCYVANYSVEGYGTDQAFVRYRDVEHTNAPIVVLAHDSNSLARNVNHFRGYNCIYFDGHAKNVNYGRKWTTLPATGWPAQDAPQ
jgi:hypothetical protein